MNIHTIRFTLRITALTLAAAALLAGGCAADRSPAPGMGDPYPAPMNDPQITVIPGELRNWLAFQPAIVTDRADADRPMQVEVPLRNMAEQMYLIDYRFLFYDLNGRELEPAMGWRMQELYPKQLVRLKAGALHNDAVDYRLEVKWSK
jgi:uncharacterized protein YcfL